MASFADLRRFGLTLPEAVEVVHFGEPWLIVRKKTFALWSATHGRAIMKLDREHQHFLFDVRPGTFTPCKVGTGGIWSYVDLGKLTKKEVEALTIEAWSQVVPKKMSRAYAAFIR
ncbi:MAG TPA: MmcQ/YjbR family DNA-binding protein [Rhizomicrobium sp.]|nr:MmcQ/YjbR family DNA-binding protein [Rhizomicrobium sp.]